MSSESAFLLYWQTSCKGVGKSYVNGQNFNVEKNILNGGLFMRQDEDKNLYLYIRSVYEDERTVEDVFRALADRADIELKIPISPEKPTST